MKTINLIVIIAFFFTFYSCSSLIQVKKLDQIILNELDFVIYEEEEECEDLLFVSNNENLQGNLVQKQITNVVIPGFQIGKYHLSFESEEYIDSIAHILKDNHKLMLMISGHTDNLGTNLSNMVLSQKRANSVKAAFINCGVESLQLSVEYFGETCPTSSNLTKQGREENRRVELSIYSL